MSFFSSSGGPEVEPIPGWYSVICGQGEYDIRALSHDDAGNRVQSYVKQYDYDLGFPLTSEHSLERTLFLEILWRRTGGDEMCPEGAVPILRAYIEPQPHQRQRHSEAPPTDPQLFTFEHISHHPQYAKGEEPKHGTTQLDAYHELKIITTWQNEANVGVSGLQVAVRARQN